MPYVNEYTLDDIRVIKDMRASGKSALEIANKLGRSRSGVQQACTRYGIPCVAPRGNPNPTRSRDRWNTPYTPEDLNRLRHMASLGLSRAVIAGRLGRSIGSINGTCAYYGIKTGGGSGGAPSHKHPPSPVETSAEENA